MYVCIIYITSLRFNADEAGTFWYHSHLGPQRMDGLFGALIVHDPKQASYPEFTVMVNDWLHIDGNAFFSRVGLGPGGSDAAQYTCKFNCSLCACVMEEQLVHNYVDRARFVSMLS